MRAATTQYLLRAVSKSKSADRRPREKKNPICSALPYACAKVPAVIEGITNKGWLHRPLRRNILVLAFPSWPAKVAFARVGLARLSGMCLRIHNEAPRFEEQLKELAGGGRGAFGKIARWNVSTKSPKYVAGSSVSEDF